MSPTEKRSSHSTEPAHEGPCEVALIGDLTESEAGVCEKLLEIAPGSDCTLYINSPGGSAYAAMAIVSLIRLRALNVTGIVTGECSSGALWPFAACRRRLVTPYSVLLFHPMKWQSEEHVQLAEAAEWARHFAELESDMDQLLAQMLELDIEPLRTWLRPGRYVTGREFADAGLAELIELDTLDCLT